MDVALSFTRGLASYTASLSCFTYNPSRHGEEIDTEIVSLAHRLAMPRPRLATKFSLNFWPSCPPLPPSILPALEPPNHQARAQIHRRPAGTKARYMHLSIPLRSPPTRLQPPSHGKAGVPASTLLSRACPLMTVIWMIHTCILLRVSQAMHTGSSRDMLGGVQVFTDLPPSSSCPCPTSRPTPSLNSAQKNNHRKGQQSSRPRRRCCKWAKPKAQTEKTPARLLQPYPGFFACLSHLASVPPSDGSSCAAR